MCACECVSSSQLYEAASLYDYCIDKLFTNPSSFHVPLVFLLFSLSSLHDFLFRFLTSHSCSRFKKTDFFFLQNVFFCLNTKHELISFLPFRIIFQIYYKWANFTLTIVAVSCWFSILFSMNPWIVAQGHNASQNFFLTKSKQNNLEEVTSSLSLPVHDTQASPSPMYIVVSVLCVR